MQRPTWLSVLSKRATKKNPLFEVIYHFEARGTRINFHSNLTMFKAESNIIESQQEKEMTIKILERTFLQGQSVKLFCAEIKSQATFHPSKRRL